MCNENHNDIAHNNNTMLPFVFVIFRIDLFILYDHNANLNKLSIVLIKFTCGVFI